MIRAWPSLSTPSLTPVSSPWVFPPKFQIQILKNYQNSVKYTVAANGWSLNQVVQGPGASVPQVNFHRNIFVVDRHHLRKQLSTQIDNVPGGNYQYTVTTAGTDTNGFAISSKTDPAAFQLSVKISSAPSSATVGKFPSFVLQRRTLGLVYILRLKLYSCCGSRCFCCRRFVLRIKLNEITFTLSLVSIFLLCAFVLGIWWL